MNIGISREDKTLAVRSEYNSGLPARAKQLGGRWNKGRRAWEFDIRAEPQVRDLYLDIYGEWDDVATRDVTIRCTVGSEIVSADQSSLQLGGRVVARAYGRDSGASLGDGVLVESGSFYSSGSRKNWITAVKPGTVFRLFDVPERKARQLTQDPEWCDSVEIVEDAEVDTKSLEDEQVRTHMQCCVLRKTEASAPIPEVQLQP